VVTIAALVVASRSARCSPSSAFRSPLRPNCRAWWAIVGIYLGFKLVGYAPASASTCLTRSGVAPSSRRPAPLTATTDTVSPATTVGTVLHPAIGPSRMYDDILLPVAPGGKGNDAIPHAKSLAERYDATVHVVVSAIDTVAQTLRGPRVGAFAERVEDAAENESRP